MHLFDAFNPVPETAICKLVRYILERSPEFRDGFVEAVNAQLTQLWLTSDAYFSCSTEVYSPVNEDNQVPGRIDLFVELDSAVLGIEVKVQSMLSSNQATKYIPKIIQHAEKLEALREVAITPVMVLLLPQAQMRNLKLDRHDSVQICTLSWQALLAQWDKVQASDSGARLVVDELRRVISQQIGEWIDFPKLLPLLKQPLNAVEHEAHRQMVTWLYSPFRGTREPLPGKLMQRRARAQRGYVGYYFLWPQLDGVWGWYGFLASQYVGEAPNLAPKLIVGTDFDIGDADASYVRPSQNTYPGFNKNARWWQIEFPKIGHDINRWYEILAPMHKAAFARARVNGLGKSAEGCEEADGAR